MYFFNMRVMKAIQIVYYKPYVIYYLKELLCFSIYYYTTHLHFCQVLFGNLLKKNFLRSNTKGGIKPLHTRRWEFIPYKLSIIYDIHIVQFYCIFYENYNAENGKTKCRIPT